MTRWKKLFALVVGCSGTAGLAWGQDVPVPGIPTSVSRPAPGNLPPVVDPGQPTASPLPLPAPPTKAAPAPASPYASGPGAPMPAPSIYTPPVSGPPFTAPTTPPAEAPPPPEGVRNGFSEPIAPDAANGFDPNPEQEDQPPGSPIFFGIDYLHWWVQKQPIPVLATTGSATDVVPGGYGQPNTKILLDDISNGGAHDGARFTIGYDFDRMGIFGVDASWFFLNQTSPTAVVGGNGQGNSQVVARPYFNVINRQQDADPVNIPNVMSGTMTASTPLRMMGADANFRWLVNSSETNGPRLTLLAGVRYMAIDEKLLIAESLGDVPGSGAGGNVYSLGENFTTYNRFYAGQVGAAFDHRIGPVVLEGIAKFAAGRMQEVLNISGYTTATESSGAIVTNHEAALYVGPGNVGRHSDGEWAVMPEGELKIAYEFNSHVRLNLGYDVLWISRVLRPGNQLNTEVNVQPLGLAKPVAPYDPTLLPFKESGLWAQGFDIGLEINF